MKVTTHTGTKPYKLFSFPAIYTLDIYRECQRAYKTSTVTRDYRTSTDTNPPRGENPDFIGIHEFQFMLWRPKLNAKNTAWNFGHFFILFQKICATIGRSNLWHGVKRR